MRFLLNFFLIFWLFIFTIYNSFAIDAPLNLKVDSINDTTVDLSWDNVDNWYMYYISYWKNSWGSYDNQTDYLESNTWTVSWLEAWNTYYFVVKALDENWDESNYSNEVSADIPEENVFSLESVVANNKKQIELTFSRELDSSTWSVREFKVYEKSDNINLYDVLSTELDKNNSTKLILNLDRDLENKIEYEVVVIAIKDKNGNNIESWINSIESFVVDENNFITTESWPVLSDIWAVLDENLNSASEIWTTEKSNTWTTINTNENEPDSTTLSNNDLEKTTLWAAAKNDKLPKTWPEEILLLVLSIILWALVFVFKYKKV